MTGLMVRASVLRTMLLAGLLVVFLRTAGIVADGGRLEGLYMRAARRMGSLQVPRGAILDRNGKRLAVDVRSFSVYADPSRVNDPHRVASLLAPILGVDPEVILRRLSRPRRSVVLAVDVDEEAAEAVERLGLPFVRLRRRRVPLAFDVYVRSGTASGGAMLKLALLWGVALKGKGQEGEVLVARSVPSEEAAGVEGLKGVRLVPVRWRERVDVVADVSDLERVREAIPLLSRALGVSVEALEGRLSPRLKFCWLKRDVSEEVASEVAVLAMGLEGVGIRQERRRLYPNGPVAGQVLGFVNIDEEGLEGLERFYDAALRPTEGKWEALTDGRGNPIPGERRLIHPPIPGFNLVLSLDIDLQMGVEEELSRACKGLEPSWASAVVMDPWSGEILAMANWPPFDPNEPGESTPFARRNHAILDTFEPGSVLKVAVAAAALEEGVAGPESRFWCGGKWDDPSFGGHPIRCWIYKVARKGHGVLTFKGAIAHSCNIALAKIAQKLGPVRLRKWFERLGLLSRTGVDFPGEPEGAIEGGWGPRKVASLGYGQGIRATLLSVARVFCAVANGGYLVRPHLAKEMRSASGGVVWRASVRRRRVLSGRTCEALREALVEAVERGTGEKAKVEGYVVAGKTGTADQINPRTGLYDPALGVASFVGFAPAERPRVVVAVAVASPKGPKWGGEVAAPIFAGIVRRALLRLGVPPEAGRLFALRPALGAL